jgi:hypothetical protein
MSVDAKESPNEDKVAVNRIVAGSLGTTFAFLKTSETKKVREHTASERSAKKTLIGGEYRIQKNAPLAPGKGLLSLPLPVSFCDDGPDRLLLPETKLCSSNEEVSISRTTRDDSSTLTLVPPKKGNVVCKLVSQTSPSNTCDVEANEVTPLTTCKTNRSRQGLVENTAENAEHIGVDTSFVKAEVRFPVSKAKDHDSLSSVNSDSHFSIRTTAENAERVGADTSFVRTEVRFPVNKAKDHDSLSSVNSDSHLNNRTEVWSTPSKLQMGKDDGDGKERISDIDLSSSGESWDASSVESASTEDFDDCKACAHCGLFSSEESCDADSVESASTEDLDNCKPNAHCGDVRQEFTELTDRISILALSVQNWGVVQSVNAEKALIQSEIDKLESESRMMQKRTEWMNGYE